MAYFLRKLDSRARWDPQERAAALNSVDVSADLLRDLPTTNMRLSVWRILEDESNLKEVITAIAASRDRPDKADYVLVDEAAITSLGIRLETKDGQTPHKSANKWHVDLVDLSARLLAELAKAVYTQQHRIGRFYEAEIKLLVRSAVENGHVVASELKQTFQKHLT